MDPPRLESGCQDVEFLAAIDDKGNGWLVWVCVVMYYVNGCPAAGGCQMSCHAIVDPAKEYCCRLLTLKHRKHQPDLRRGSTIPDQTFTASWLNARLFLQICLEKETDEPSGTSLRRVCCLAERIATRRLPPPPPHPPRLTIIIVTLTIITWSSCCADLQSCPLQARSPLGSYYGLHAVIFDRQQQREPEPAECHHRSKHLDRLLDLVVGLPLSLPASPALSRPPSCLSSS